MTHIVIDARESGTSTGRYVDKLVEYLHAIETTHTFTLLTKKQRVEFLNALAPRFKVAETSFEEFSFDEQVGLRKQIRSLHPDLVHFPMVQQPAFYGGTVVTTMNDLTTIRFRNPTKNPVIFWGKQQIYKWLNKRVAKKSVELVTYSEFVKQDVASYCHVPESKITVTPLSADSLASSTVALQSLAGTEFIMYVGRPLPHKNLGRLIEAFAVLQETYPDLCLVLAGKKDATYKIHEKMIEKRCIRNVISTDFIEDSQLRWLYENCRAYVFPSLSEGFGLPALEAMLHGAPVISSNATSLPEVCGDAALYFDPLNVEDIAEKIGRVLSDDRLRTELITKGCEQVKKFSWERMAQQTLEVYEKALRG